MGKNERKGRPKKCKICKDIEESYRTYMTGIEQDGCFYHLRCKITYCPMCGNKITYLGERKEQKVGTWIRGDFWSEGCGMGEIYGYYYKCSECGAEVKGDYKKCDYNFCHNCGTIMKEGD